MVLIPAWLELVEAGPALTILHVGPRRGYPATGDSR